MKNNMYCPLMEQEIEYEICFDISMVVDEGAPISTAPKEATQREDFREICLKCPNHRND